jgi:hypothetical protein
MLMLGTLLGVISCQQAPQPQYVESPRIVQKRAELKQKLLELLPEKQRSKAEQEAAWLADTAYKGAAAIARYNDPIFVNWLNNRAVNTRYNFRQRGLCWHYQHDMYRELRRRPLKYFRIGCCVRDAAKASEHNCVYIAPKGADWPHAWVLDAWMWNGRLKVDDARELSPARWSDLPSICRVQSFYYPEGHQWPIEHWSVLRAVDGNYEGYWQPETQRSAQYSRMYRNVEQGKKDHPGRLTNY